MKKLFDTSLWINHFQKGNEELIESLQEDTLLIHENIILELAAGSLKDKRQTISYLASLNRAETIPFEEIRAFIEEHKLYSKGLSIVDIEIIASALVASASVISLDRKLVKTWSDIAGK